MIEEDDTLRLQPCLSPVWDTALALNALADAGLSTQDPAVAQAVRWLLDAKCRRPGDWSLTNPRLEPAGWFFEYRNGFYPDTDDTAMVLMALARTGHGRARPERQRGRQRGLHWLLAHAEPRRRLGGLRSRHQPRDPHQGARSPITTPCSIRAVPDITARVLEALGPLRLSTSIIRRCDRAVAFIRRDQDRSGCWLGRWGVNYIYGTWQVLVGLRAIGFDMQRSDGAPGGRLAQEGAAARRRLGRNVPQLRRSGTGRPGRRRRRRRRRGRCSA